ncbi:MAG: RNA methyltransferase [Acidobacteria bacterium]|nr:RNA methyltransferase [Acidobacteriota bacterium]
MRIFGFHPVREALRHRPRQIRRVWLARGRDDRRRREISELCRRHGISFGDAPAELLAELDQSVHNGFIAEAEDAVAGVQAGMDLELQVLLEDIQDPRNLGALLRVCEGAGVGKVLIRDRGSAPLSPAAVKTSAGAADWLDIDRIPNSAREMERLKGEGYWVYGADAAGKPAWQIDLKGKVLLCFGGEENGLRQRTRSLCDELIALPMRGRVASLNVATAAAAILYEAVRQRISAT